MIDKTNPCVWDALKKTDKPIILYGMGNGADKVLERFSQYNIKCSGVMASDDFVRYQKFHDFTVKKLSDFEHEYGDFVVALCFASNLDNVMSNIKHISMRHALLVPNVPVYGKEIVDDDFLTTNKTNIEAAYYLMADDQSRIVFKYALNFLYSGKIDFLDSMTTDKSEAFENILKLSKNESYLDLGAYKGDTIDEFLNYTGCSYSSITAVEPNPKNYKKLCEHCTDMNNVHCINAGISDTCSTMYVSKNSGRQSVLSTNGSIKIDTFNIDYISSDPTYIKADIEGMEHQMLLGAVSTLSKKPKLNIAAYHKSSDLFLLPLLINSINKSYRIYLRKHPYIPCWDMNLYCV